MANLEGTQTDTNLKTAFARESEANRRYLYFAHKADVDGHPQIAELFRSVADGETGHAFGHLDFLGEIGDPATGDSIESIAETLKSAIVSELYEATEMYPAFAQTARDEGLVEIAEWFETVARAEKNHADRFGTGLAGLEGKA